jgi:hypothetical protein
MIGVPRTSSSGRYDVASWTLNSGWLLPVRGGGWLMHDRNGSGGLAAYAPCCAPLAGAWPCTLKQAIAFKLNVCVKCFPDRLTGSRP